MPDQYTKAQTSDTNVTTASESQQQQADQTINQDPTVSSGDVQSAGADNYDDENQWGYRELQQEAKNRGMDAGGKREELVARLRGGSSGSGGDGSDGSALSSDVDTTDADTSNQPGVPRSEVDPSQSPEGGQIGMTSTGRGQEHAEILQGLSDERRAQQLAEVNEQSERNKG